MEHLENRDMMDGAILTDTFVLGNVTEINGAFYVPNNCIVKNLRTIPTTIYLAEENETVDGAEGGPLTVYGGSGNDKIIGSNYNDTLIGGSGDDSISGLDGDDLLIGNSETTFYEALKNLSTENDSLDGGAGFDRMIGSSVDFDFDISGSEIIVSNLTEWNTALTLAAPGIKINLAKEVPQLFGNLNGATLNGNGFNVGGLFLTGGGLIQNITIDLFAQMPRRLVDTAYNVLRDGEFYVDDVTIKNAPQNYASIYFANCTAIMNESSVYDGQGDLISAGGSGHLYLVNSTGYNAGPNQNNQVVTTHFGFQVDVIGGNYYDAHTNVVAPDSNSIINMYYVTVSRGLRNGGIFSSLPNEIYGCTITTTGMSVRGSLENSYVYGYGQTTLQLYTNSIVKNNYVSGNRGANLRENHITLIDNVFECTEDWFIFNGTIGHIIDGNISL